MSGVNWTTAWMFMSDKRESNRVVITKYAHKSLNLLPCRIQIFSHYKAQNIYTYFLPKLQMTMTVSVNYNTVNIVICNYGRHFQSLYISNTKRNSIDFQRRM